VENTRFRYGFTVNRNKVHSEWLLEAKTPFGKEYPVFLRGDDQFQIDYKRFENADALESKTRIDALFLSVASQWNVEKALNIVKWFRNIQIIHGIDKNRFSRRTVEFLMDERYSSIIKELINKADLGISDLGIRELEAGIQTDLFGNNVSEYEINYRRLNIYTVHTKFSSENLPIGNVRFSLNKDESEGTIKYFDIIGQLLFALQNNSLIVIDEFDARLHTLLSKAIIRLFNSSKSKSKAQLFVASHDTALLDRRLLRRDQIYFVNKNQYGASEVTALVEYKTRKESPYDKNYLEGKYGAIPFIEEFESFLKNAE
jgi:AAA15 family ATPase/GTPase